ncbi:GntR family transcriptional regulator [Pseudactinotalea terrae]|uniref:GntR family transcriptional regulator n=1 Tax=Pseudactinotalea terrae TaxID=1743262 RepID=UPI0012E0F907|nr:GntR family transcriptional regulator [Pseudactinotalea terrae]
MADHELQTRSVVDAVEEELRNQLLRGEVDAGDGVTEVGVAARFKIGRPTAKAALDRLVNDGILTRNGRRGLIVRVLSAHDIGELYESRIVLESHVASSLATRRDVPETATLQNDLLRLAATRNDASVVVASDVQLHHALVRAHGNERISKMHSTLMAEAHLCMARVQARQLLRAEQIADEHATILSAIAAGDPESARNLTRAHLERARDKLLATMFSEQAP